MFRRLWGGVNCGVSLPRPIAGCHYGVYPNCSGNFLFSLRRNRVMQVVVVKSPKILKGVLKLIFGIKKTEE